MKFKYLGTAVAEGFPAVFCNCCYCQEARRLKGKNIRTRSQAILYCNDTGYLYEDVFDYLSENHIKLDLISLDCTMVNNPVKDTGSHMGFDGCNRVVLRLKELGVVNDSTQVYVNHFSHNGNPIHENLEILAKEYNMKVSFDGLEIELL